MLYEKPEVLILAEEDAQDVVIMCNASSGFSGCGGTYNGGTPGGCGFNGCSSFL